MANTAAIIKPNRVYRLTTILPRRTNCFTVSTTGFFQVSVTENLERLSVALRTKNNSVKRHALSFSILRCPQGYVYKPFLRLMRAWHGTVGSRQLRYRSPKNLQSTSISRRSTPKYGRRLAAPGMFPGGHPSKYYPGSMLLNFCERANELALIAIAKFKC